MMQSIPLTDGPLRFEGAVSVQTTDRGVMPWRLPCDQLHLFNSGLVGRAACPSGVRLTLASDTRNLELDIELGHDSIDPDLELELYIDGQPHGCVRLPLEPGTAKFHDLPGEGMRKLEVYLDPANPIRFTAARIDQGATAEPVEDTRPIWLTYGSSITQCRTADRPGEVWPAIVARQFNVRCYPLGYGGHCKLQTSVGRVIRDLDFDFISICLGINVHGGDLSAMLFRDQAIGLIQLVRERHPTTPMVIISPIFSPPREEPKEGTAQSLPGMRQTLQDVVQLLREHGDTNLHYADGMEIFGPELERFLPDKLHPDADGYRHLAANFARVVMPLFGLDPVAEPAAAQSR